MANKLQSQSADFTPAAASLADLTKQRCLMSNWCCDLVNWMKHRHRL